MVAKRRKSKKRSAANSRSKRPERPTLFLDASLGGHIIARALRASGADVITHDERFKQGTPDEAWLSEAGRQGRLVLSKDRRIRYNEVERRAIIARKVGAFFLTSGNLTGKQMAVAFVRALPKIYRITKNRNKPFIATIDRSGRVTLRSPGHP